MKIKKGDLVIVITGKDKGKTGAIKQTFPTDNKVTVEGLNLRTKFTKAGQGQPGKQTKFEGRMDISNVMLVDPSTKKPTRVGYTTNSEGKKVRVSKKSNEVIE